MNIIYFDCETTGLPRDWRAPVTDLNNWPRLVQIAWIQYNSDSGNSNAFEYIIRPEGFEIPAAASDVHGITTERALDEGVSLQAVLDVFGRRMAAADVMVAHNIAFDRKIMGAELIRNGFPDSLHGKPRVCTMLSTIKFCNIPGKYGRPKWPKLQELHEKLFGEMFADAHDALADITATARCFEELVKRGVIKLPEIKKEGKK